MMRERPGFGRLWRGVLVAAGAVVSCARAETSSLPESVNLQQLVHILREKSPRLIAERTRIDVAQAEVVAAEVLPNPTISYGRYDLVGGVNTLFDGDQQEQAILEIPVLVTGQRPARREAARRGVMAAEAQVFNAYAGLLKNAWQLFVKLMAVQARSATLEQTEAELGRLQTIVTGRAEAGAASRYEVVRMEVEAAGLRARTEQTRAETADIAGQIGTTLSLPGWRPKAEGTLQPIGVKVDLAALKQQAEAANPAVNAARREEETAVAVIEKAKRERWPVPEILVGNVWTTNPSGHATFGGLSVEIPLFDRGQGPIARAEADKVSATFERQALLYAILAEVERTTGVLQKNKENLARFEQDVAGRLPQLKEMAEDAYRFGKGSLLELLDATRSRTEISLRRVELTEAVVLAEIDALAAAGALDTAAAKAESKSR